MLRIFVRSSLLCLVVCMAQAVEWSPQRLDGRDCLPVSQIAAFYSMSISPGPAPGETVLQNSRNTILLKSGSREAVIDGLRQWLSFPATPHDGQLWVTRLDLSKTLEPALRPEQVVGLRKPRTIVLDPGHGGSDKGASSSYQYEKNFNLDVARRLRDALRRRGMQVVLTRNSNTFVELPDRALMFRDLPDAIFVSLHFNASTNLAAQGLEIYSITPRGAPSTEYENMVLRDMFQEPGNAHEVESFLLSKSIHHALNGMLNMADRGAKRARFAILRLSPMPSVLVEGGFLTNPQDARRIASPEWRTQYADAIAEGIAAYAALAEHKIPPLLAKDYRAGKRPRIPDARPETPPASVKLRELP